VAGDKTPLRSAREAAGLSRKEVADKLDTTVHHYWQCEMPQGNPDPELLQRALSLLGVGGSGGRSPQASSQGADLGTPRGQLTWVCPRCGDKMTTLPGTLEVSHPCPKSGKKRVMYRLELQT
jgi:transcriptional regulator with XRE-family HTH domain